MPEEAEKKKAEVLKLLIEVEARAATLEGLGQSIVQSARFSRDVVKPMSDFISQLPAASLAPEQWDHQISALRAWRAGASQIELSPTLINSFGAQSFAMASTGSTGMLYVTSGTLPPTPARVFAISQLNDVLERNPLADTARASLRRLGLDRRAGDVRSPLDLLEEAKAAFERPSRPEDSPASVLIPLRQCILGAEAALLQRRPVQEPTPNRRAKLTSLGQQCARHGLKTEHFEGLATNMDAVVNVLSGAKQAGMPRQQVSQLFNQGLTLLSALLGSIDETQLR